MSKNTLRAVTLLSVVLTCACASGAPPARRVWVGPRIDLKPYEIIGMVGFSSSSKGALASMASRRFMDAARRDQEMLRMIDMGTQAAALATVNQAQWTPDACRAIGKKNNVKTLFYGKLTLSKVRPTVQLSALLNSGTVTAQVDATLEVQMVEAETGASIWSNSATSSRTVGQVSVFGSKDYAFDAADPNAAYGDLVDSLVTQVVRDFQGYWTTQQ